MCCGSSADTLHRKGSRLKLPLALLVLCASNAWSQTWEPVTGVGELRALFSDTVMTATLAGGATAEAHYNSDGSGVLKAWGATFPRRWEVKGHDQVCLDVGNQVNCFNIEVDSSDPATYRARNVDTGETVVFEVDRHQLAVTASPNTSKGGAVQPSAEEVAAKLANPNTPLASLTLKLQYRTYQGNLPTANDQDGTTLLFQPSFPFSLANGDVRFLSTCHTGAIWFSRARSRDDAF